MNRLSKGWKRLQGNLLFLYIRLVSLTSSWQIEGEENVDAARATGRPLFYCLWHGQQMLSVLYVIRFDAPRDFAVPIVGDERFFVLGTLYTRLGAETYAVNMQGNPLAAGRAVLRLIQAMKKGKTSGILPDGPDGPPFVPKRGVAVIARKATAVILPVGASTRQAFQMRRWDRYLIPFPFARIHIVIGEPICVSRDQNEETLLNSVADALNDASKIAQHAAGIQPTT